MKNLLFWANLLLAICTQAQTNLVWEINYGGSNRDEPMDVLPTSDGGYLLTGFSKSTDGDVSGNHGDIDYWVLKVDMLGQKQWEKSYGGSSIDLAEVALPTADGGYLIAGGSSSNDGDIFIRHGSTDAWVIKINAVGNLVWEKTYGGFFDEAAYDMCATADGNFILVGGSQSDNDDLTSNYGQNDVWVVKINPNGDIIWQKSYGGTLNDIGYSIQPTVDGGYIVAGSTSSGDTDISQNWGVTDCWAFKIDGIGNMQWEKNYGGGNLDVATRMKQTSDGGFVLLGRTNSFDQDVSVNHGDGDVWVVKTDALGNILWEKTIGGPVLDSGSAIEEDADGDFILVGSTQSDREGNTIPNEVLLAKLSPNGNVKWEQRYGGPGADSGTDLAFSPNDGLLLVGHSRQAGWDVTGNNGERDIWILSVQQVPGLISGHIFLDYNGNCQDNGIDTTIANVLVFAENIATGDILFTVTDTYGFYQLETDTTAYQVGYWPPSPYFGAPVCSPSPRTVTLNSSQQTDTLDFYVRPTQYCPYLSVDIGSGLLRRCVPTYYSVHYCNDGAATAFNGFVNITFDPILSVTGSSIAWSNVTGNTYTFPLGNIDVFECGDFTVQVEVGCDSAYIGQSVCVEAHIYPDTVCILGVAWDRSELKATATCISKDSVRLELQNIGIGDMADPVPFLVIEDVIMRNSGEVKLNSLESTSWTLPVQGLTQRISAGQSSSHPFKTYTTAAVNLCNTETLPPVPGPIDDFLTVYQNDEEAPYVAIDCSTIIGAFDPNDKTASPKGRGLEGIITANTELSYKIRFQNTGNDTAFNIVVVDTLLAQLDVNTFKPGTSSHPYRFEVSGHGIVKFIFENIQLPDSSTNYPGSNGFVQFNIRQRAGNADGVVISNRAGIYFDFNPPVITDPAINTIGEIYVEETVSTVDAGGYNLQIFPNPAHDKLTVSLDEAVSGFEVLLYDLQGRLLRMASGSGHSVQIQRQDLPAGLYGFQVRGNGKLLATGKLIFR